MSLSDKIILNPKAKRKGNDIRPNDYVYVEHLHEAIKELKEEILRITEVREEHNIFCMVIQKIFGDKLI